MSHAPERQEKNCLNCGGTVIGRFCHVCGQENIVPKESFGSLVIHFFSDITHFDGKFFQSIKYLLFRPGFLSKEFVNGRRASHLNPVRMYVFTSAIFFLIFFMIVEPEKLVRVNNNSFLDSKARLKMIDDLEKEYRKKNSDTAALLKELQLLRNFAQPVTKGILDSVAQSAKQSDKGPRTFAEYDSLQKTLPPEKRDGWLSRITKKKFQYNKDLEENPADVLTHWVEAFLHKMPYLLFVSLPLFAAILKLLYVRRKQFYYADHAIFSIHHYVFSFILLLLIFLLSALRSNQSWDWLILIVIVLFLAWPVHLYLAMLNFYAQGRFKTFVKFVLLNILGLFSLLLLFTVFMVLSIFQL